jgi:two-component system sensor histidine kinase ChiS
MTACSFVASAVNESRPLLVDEECQQTVREDVHIIETSLHFVNDLLRSMLDLHRVSSKNMVVDNSPADVMSDILQPVASMLTRRDDVFQVQIECPQNLIVVTDRLRLKQVVLNLGRNAIKFVDEGFVRLKADVIDGRVRICVEDSGPGIRLDKRDQLFQKFQDSLDSLNQGTGVGLSLCKNLVDLMGGELWLDETYASGFNSNPGTRFIIDLKTAPLSMESFSSLHTVTTAGDTISSYDAHGDVEDNSLNGSRELPEHLSVLFVDDDITLRKLFCRSIRKNWPDWTVCEAASGEVALNMVETQEFDIIFIDQYMSGVEKQLLGTETTRSLRAKGYKARICGLSANDLEGPFKSAGANAFVMKPFPCKLEPLKAELLRVLDDDE